MNYTDEVADYMVMKYTKNPSRITVNELAEELDKPIKSIIGKLSKLGVYRREIYKTKLGETPITKLELTYSIAEMLDLDPDHLIGLDKSPKPVLKLLESTLITTTTVNKSFPIMRILDKYPKD